MPSHQEADSETSGWPRPGPRRLLVLDVEGTLFETSIRLPGTDLDSTIWQGLAKVLGVEAEADEVETHRRWATGGYANYLEWMVATIEMHVRHGITRSIFESVVAEARYRPNAVRVVRDLDRSELEPVLVSGGFQQLARRAQVDMRIRHAFAACEYLFGADGHVAGYNLLPCDFAGKIDFVRLLLREYSLDDSDWIFVGDGANDVEIAAAAPFSVGVRPHRRLREVVDIAIDDFDELSEVLGRRGLSS